MRLWHKDLIPYLPKQQLLGQWRELNSVFKLQNRHVLINFVYDYPPKHLHSYSGLIIVEMSERGYKLNNENFFNYFADVDNTLPDHMLYDEIFAGIMNDRYLRQCLYNLQEKYDRGGITESEWQLIYNNFKQFIEG